MLKTRVIVRLVLVVVAGWAGVSVSAQSDDRRPSSPSPARAAAAPTREVLNRYCVGCHNERIRTAGLALDTLDINKIGEAPAVWEQVILKLRAQTMPPANSPRPEAATYREVAAWLEGEVDRAAAVRLQPGRTETFHRLNRGEYQNAIRDLLALDLDVGALLPTDNTFEHGFDNNADSLSVSPDLSARYLSAARKISRLAVGRPPVGPTIDTYRIHPELVQDDRLSDDLPFGSRGGIAIHHYFPVDGEYVLKIRLHRNFSDYIKGFSTPHEIDVRLDRTLITRLSAGGEAKGKMAPLSFSGNIAGDPEWEYYMNTGDSHLEARFSATAGHHLVGVSFAQRTLAADGVLQPRQRGYGRFVDEYFDGNASIEQVAIGGPYRIDGPGDTPSRRQIFVCRPSSDRALPARSGARGRAAQPARHPLSATTGAPGRFWPGWRSARTGALRAMGKCRNCSDSTERAPPKMASMPASNSPWSVSSSIPTSCFGSNASDPAPRPDRFIR